MRDNYLVNKDFGLFVKDTFGGDDVAVFSRGDLFSKAKGDIKTAVFSIIFWGYPRNMRGNTFNSILTSLPDIEKMLSGTRKLDVAGYSRICRQLKGKGIGLSTLSKLLYFFGFELEGHRCLILDSRIIEVINAGTFEELKMGQIITRWNKQDKYLDYLKLVQKVAEESKCSVDQLELFLFQFGRNLKAAVA